MTELHLRQDKIDTMEIEKLLRDHKIRPSYQRVQILQYLKTHKTHPTVEMIYTDLHPQIPTFSKTTVYNTMKLLVDKGLVAAITIDDGEIRFDGDISSHGHFKCRKCGSIEDLFFDGKTPEYPPIPEGFQLETIHYYGWGLCPQCQKN